MSDDSIVEPEKQKDAEQLEWVIYNGEEMFLTEEEYLNLSLKVMLNGEELIHPGHDPTAPNICKI